MNNNNLSYTQQYQQHVVGPGLNHSPSFQFYFKFSLRSEMFKNGPLLLLLSFINLLNYSDNHSLRTGGSNHAFSVCMAAQLAQECFALIVAVWRHHHSE